MLVSLWIAWLTAPRGAAARTARDFGVEAGLAQDALPPRTRPGEWLEYSPLLTLLLSLLAFGWLGGVGWAVQVYNAAEALPNLVNPFWMLPLLGVLGLKARDIVGFTFVQLLVHLPLVLLGLWLLGSTLEYLPPQLPTP